MDEKVSGLLPIPAVDRATDYLYIVDQSAGASYRVTPNILLGINGDPVGTSDTQTLTNKTLGDTNVATLRDDRFTLQDDGDVTKQLRLQLSGITAGQTRTLTVPDRSSTIATLDGAQTFAGANSFTGSSWTGGTISNATVNVNSIAGFTTPNAGTIYGISISGGAIQSSSALAPGIVIPNTLQSGAGTTWVWQSWVPTFTNLSGGTLNYARYCQIGKTVHFKIKYTLAGAGVSGRIIFSTPVTMAAMTALDLIEGSAAFYDVSSVSYAGIGALLYVTATTIGLNATTSDVTYSGLSATGTSATIPFTWAANDVIQITGTYEAA